MPRRVRTSKALTLVITSDRGLCGPYNGAILRKMMEHFRSTTEAREGADRAGGQEGPGDAQVQQDQRGDPPHALRRQAVVRGCREAGADVHRSLHPLGEISGVKVIYMRFVSAGKQMPEIKQLLPFVSESPVGEQKEAGAGAGASAGGMAFEFSPSPRELMDDLLPAALKAALFQSFNDAIVSEHVARMVAMKAATDNAGKMGKRLSRAYNRARQAQITTELTEIISGAAALG
jgi:F-type H+-transporting ATPase subunit gamma